MSSLTIQELVAKNIKYFRKSKGLSQEMLSKACGLSVRFISRAENNPQNLTLETLKTISDALDVSIADLLQASSTKKALPLKGYKKASEALDETIKFLQAYRSMLD